MNSPVAAKVKDLFGSQVHSREAKQRILKDKAAIKSNKSLSLWFFPENYDLSIIKSFVNITCLFTMRALGYREVKGLKL